MPDLPTITDLSGAGLPVSGVGIGVDQDRASAILGNGDDNIVTMPSRAVCTTSQSSVKFTFTRAMKPP